MLVVRTDGGAEAEVDEVSLKSCRRSVLDAITEGADYDDIAQIVSDELGLEMNYAFSVLGL